MLVSPVHRYTLIRIFLSSLSAGRQSARFFRPDVEKPKHICCVFRRGSAVAVSESRRCFETYRRLLASVRNIRRVAVESQSRVSLRCKAARPCQSTGRAETLWGFSLISALG